MWRGLFLLTLVPALAIEGLSLADRGTGLSTQGVHDPPPLTEKAQWIFDLRWDRGDVYLVDVHKIDMPSPMTTPRVLGRFAIELTDKGVLIERTRFDFPGLAVPDADGGIRMTARLRTRIGVFFPATSRGDKLELVDRTTAQHWALPWPPQTNASDAGGGG
jgi:hypothetical protein